MENRDLNKWIDSKREYLMGIRRITAKNYTENKSDTADDDILMLTVGKLTLLNELEEYLKNGE